MKRVSSPTRIALRQMRTKAKPSASVRRSQRTRPITRRRGDRVARGGVGHSAAVEAVAPDVAPHLDHGPADPERDDAQGEQHQCDLGNPGAGPGWRGRGSRRRGRAEGAIPKSTAPRIGRPRRARRTRSAGQRARRVGLAGGGAAERVDGRQRWSRLARSRAAYATSEITVGDGQHGRASAAMPAVRRCDASQASCSSVFLMASVARAAAAAGRGARARRRGGGRRVERFASTRREAGRRRRAGGRGTARRRAGQPRCARARRAGCVGGATGADCMDSVPEGPWRSAR